MMNFNLRDLTATGWLLVAVSAAVGVSTLLGLGIGLQLPSSVGWLLVAGSVLIGGATFVAGALVLARLGRRVLRAGELPDEPDAREPRLRISAASGAVVRLVVIVLLVALTAGFCWGLSHGVEPVALIGAGVFGVALVVQVVRFVRSVITLSLGHDIRIRQPFGQRIYGWSELELLSAIPAKSGRILHLRFAGGSAYRLPVSDREARLVAEWFERMGITEHS